jgi:Spy/CpxP family protein refolding chaperone
MHLRKRSFGVAVVVLVSMCLLAASPLSAQGMRGRPPARMMGQGTPGQGAQGNPLAMLQRSLQQAGAAALTSDQTTQLTSLITAFRSNQPKPGQDTVLTGARTALDSAILSGDTNGVSNAATTIAGEMSKIQYQQTVAEANFEISALAVLTTSQVTALQTKLGTTGLVRVLGSMVGGPGMLGRMGGPGR